MFVQLKRIKLVDKTPEQAIASYGSFVSYVNNCKKQITTNPKRHKRWTAQRVSVSKAANTVSIFHQVISEKFGIDVMYNAIKAHPFNSINQTGPSGP